MNKTTMTGVVIILIAVLTAIKDILSGNFDFNSEMHNLLIALNGSGFIFGRAAIQKIIDFISSNSRI